MTKFTSRMHQSNGITERTIHQLMKVARSHVVKAGRGEDYWFFAGAGATLKIAGMSHEYLGGEPPHERLKGKPFNYDRLAYWDQNASYISTSSNGNRLQVPLVREEGHFGWS